jgi:hypothetical protein
VSAGENSDLQICFINEAVREEDEDDLKDDAKEDSSGDEEEILRGRALPRSRSEWDAASVPAEEEELARKAAFRKKLVRLQREVRLNLSDCREIARRHVAKERERLRQQDPLRKLIGVKDDFNFRDKASLERLSLAALQVVVNQNLNQIEALNEELVASLLAKDELYIEQESQLVDIADLSHSLTS